MGELVSWWVSHLLWLVSTSPRWVILCQNQFNNTSKPLIISKRSISLIDGTQTGSKREPGRNVNERVTPQSLELLTTRFCLVIYLGHSFWMGVLPLCKGCSLCILGLAARAPGNVFELHCVPHESVLRSMLAKFSKKSSFFKHVNIYLYIHLYISFKHEYININLST